MINMVDLTVKFDTLTFKNPILVGPLVVTEYPPMLERGLAHQIGGVITPTYTADKENTFRPKPFIVSPRALFPDLQDMFLTLAEFSAVPIDIALEKHLPTMHNLCSNAGVPLIGSVLATADIDATVKLAADVASKADGLELNTSYLDKENAPEVLNAVKKTVGVPTLVRMNSWMNNAQSLGSLAKDGVKSMTVHARMPKGMLVDTELEEPFALNWPSSTMFGKFMLPVSLGLTVNILNAQPDANLISIDAATQSEDVIQHLLMGCKAVSVCYGVQMHGYKHADALVDGITGWMEGKGYQKIGDFAGNALKSVNGAVRPDKRFKHPDEFGAEFMPMVDAGICKPKECIRCEEYCLHEVYKVNAQEAKVDVKDENCIGCGICVGLCPEGAITLVNRCTEQPVLENRGTAKVYVGKKQGTPVTTTKRSTYGFRSYVTYTKTE